MRNMKQTMETTRKSDKVPTPTVTGLSTPQANTFPFVNWAHISIQNTIIIIF